MHFDQRIWTSLNLKVRPEVIVSDELWFFLRFTQIPYAHPPSSQRLWESYLGTDYSSYFGDRLRRGDIVPLRGPALLTYQKASFIRPWIHKKGLKRSGKKADLIERLVPSLDDNEWEEIHRTAEPRYIVTHTIRTGLEERLDELREEYVKVCERVRENPVGAKAALTKFMNEQIPYPVRGVGMSMGMDGGISPKYSWKCGNYELAWASIVPELEGGIQREVIDYNLGIVKDLGENLAVAFDAANRVYNRLELERFPAGSTVVIGVAGSACDQCRKLRGREFSKTDVPVLPNPNCTNDGHGYCRCSYERKI